MPAAISRAPSAPWEQGGLPALPLRVSPQWQRDSGNSWAWPPSLTRAWTRLPDAKPNPQGLGRSPQPSALLERGSPRMGKKRVDARASRQHQGALPAPGPRGSHRWGATDRLPLWASFSSNTNLETRTALSSAHPAVYTNGLIQPSEPARSSSCPHPTSVGSGRAGQGRVGRGDGPLDEAAERSVGPAPQPPPAGDAISCSAERTGGQQPMASTTRVAESPAETALCARGGEGPSEGRAANCSQVRLLPRRAELSSLATRLWPQRARMGRGSRGHHGGPEAKA